MKILQVIPYFCFGGAEIMCENLTYALKAMGQDVTVVSLYDEHTPISERMERAGIRILYLDKKLGLDVSMVPKLTRLMKQERPDVVHTHLDVIKYAALAAFLAGVKTCIHTVHSVADREAEGPLQKIINRTYYRLGLSTPVALSPEVRESIASFYGLDKDRIPVIYNGIDLSRCVPKEDYGLGDKVKILHVGRFDLPKNHPGLLKAFQKLHEAYPQCCLQLVGDGETRKDMEALAEELGIREWVTFCGMQTDVHPYLQNADLFVLPSIYEGNPMTIIEAMGTGLPIVATAVGGIPDMLEDGKNALLVPCDIDAVVKACETMIQDEGLRARLGRQARLDSPRFSAQFMAERYCECYSGRKPVVG
ncbi:MAG: glycosyltransferase [Faecousia sp.]